MLVGERLSLSAHAHATNVPSAEVGEIYLVKTGATKSGICGAGNHCSFAVDSEKHYSAGGTHAINFVRGVAGHVQIALLSLIHI